MSGRYSLNLPIDLKQKAEQVAKEQGISLNQLILWSLSEKVMSLKSSLPDPNFPGIVYKFDAQNYPMPVLRGNGIRVQTIVIVHHVWGESVQDIARQYHLPIRRVKEALAYYEANKSRVDELIEANDKL